MTATPRIKPPTKRQQAKAATQAKVLAAAREAFHHSGYYAVRIRDLAKAVGMSTGAIFSSFPSKAELFEAATGEKAPDILGFLEKIVDAARLASVDPARGQALAELAIEARRLRGSLIGNPA